MKLSRKSFVLAGFIAALFGVGQVTSQVINQSVAVCDPNNPGNCVAPSGGAMPISGTVTTSAVTANANATAPTYTAGPQPLSQDLNGNLRTVVSGSISATTTATASSTAPTYTAGPQPLSQDLSGNLRVTGSFSATTAAQATSAAPTYVNNTSNPISQDLSGNLRTTLTTAIPAGANTIGNVGLTGGSVGLLAGSSIVGKVGIDQTTPGTTNGVQINAALPTGANTIGTVNLGTANVTATGNVASGAADSGNPVKIGAVYNTTTPTLTAGQRGDLQIDNNGRLTDIGPFFTMAYTDGQSNNQNFPGGIASGTRAAIFNSTYGFLFNGTTWDRQRMDSVGGAWVAPATSSGTSNNSIISAATTNSTLVKASSGVITEITAYNNSATIAYLKVYNQATAPTCGTGTPVARYLIPASTSGAGTNVDIALGKTFSTGIAYCVTGGIADADTTATAANAYIVNMTFK